MLDDAGVFAVTEPGRLQLWRVGQPMPTPAVDLGRTATRRISGAGRTVLYQESVDDPVGVLSLDPAMWRAELCTELAGRDLTAAETARLPVSAGDGPACPEGPPTSNTTLT